MAPRVASSSRPSRRRFLQASVLFGGGLLATACGGAPAAPTTAPTSGGETTKPSTAATTAPAVIKPSEAAKAPAAATQPVSAAKPAASGGQVTEIARNRTLKVVFGGRDGKWVDFDNWNPYSIGGTHQYGANLLYEPLAYYSAFADKELLWLAESYAYSPDFKQLTIKTRGGISWSDGEPFSAEDVAFTLNYLKDNGAKVRWGADVQPFVESAAATDANTVEIKFKAPAPRFFFFMTYKFDIGVYPAPKHIFDGQDFSQFTHFDLAKGWPVTTGPWQVVFGSPEQKIIDRRADWWAVKAGLVDAMPKVERLIYLPMAGETQLAQALITNEVDTGLLIVNTFKVVLEQNQKITTHTGREKPYGYIDWWPLSLYVNNEREPWNDKEVRWALSYMLDREQIVQISYEGASSPSQLPMPVYPPLLPYFDAVEDLLDKYDTTKHDPARAAELLQGKGWTKSGAVWMDDKGQPVKLDIMGFSFMSALGPVVAEQLKQQGIDATFSMPPDAGQLFTQGNYNACIFGHGGSVRDPYDTLRLYQTVAQFTSSRPNLPRWKNDAFDKVVDQVYMTSMDDKPKLIELFKQAMEIWLPELPDVQITKFYHNIARNEIYWTGWPTKDNPYVNEASWHLTWQLVLNQLQPAQ